MRNTHMSKSVSFIVVAGASLLLLGAPAFATSVPGYSGKSVGQVSGAKNAAVTCLTEVNGGVTNSCGNQQLYEIPLPVNSGGSHTVDVSVYNYSGTFNCGLYAADKFGTLVTGTNYTPASSYVYFPLSVTVPSGSDYIGTMYLYCQFGPGSVIWNVNYTP